jgi:hypothetical protein
MSNRSRGRHALAPATAPEPTADDKAVAERLDDALNTPGKAGLRKLVGMVLDARNKPDPETDPDDDPDPANDPRRGFVASPFREPTPYEMAILGAMKDKPMYGGTVEPWRVDERRARNKARRRTRQRQQRRARGRSNAGPLP